MSEDNSPAPRRSQRDRKPTKPFTSVTNTKKRKRDNESDTEDDAPDNVGEKDAETEAEGDNEEEEETFEQRTPKNASARKKATPKKANAGPKIPGRRARKPVVAGEAYDADKVAKDTKISADNPLFNAIMNPASPLQSSAEDFLESLQLSPGPALAELINLVLRSCGCNDSVDADQVVDFDGIVSTLDDFTESLKQENSPVYPLTSRLPIFKRFRKSLSEWIERLIISASDMGTLYSTEMMDTLQQWVVTMSSSQIRSFRHTASVIALEAETALCGVAAAVDKESDTVDRQREGEKRRKGKPGRLTELDAKAKEIKRRQSKLKTYIKDIVDGVFVHRFRDLDPNIRAECVSALGLWLRKYPEHFLDAHYLRYIGWVLSDIDNHVRLETVKALSGVYDQTDYIPSLTHFTERFKSRLLEMATSDVEVSIRVAVIHVLGDIETHFPLEDEEKKKLCLLLFDEEHRVRRAVSPFVRAVWEEDVETQVDAQSGNLSEKDKERIGMKVFGTLLVKWGKSLSALAGDADESEIGDEARENEEGSVSGASRRAARRKEVLALVTDKKPGRVSLAVEALWTEVAPASDWEGLLELLLLDHSSSEESQASSAPSGRARPNGKGKKQTDDFVVDDAWRLDEAEESVLLEVLVAALRAAKEQSTGGKKGEEENVSNDITRALIKGLPRLFIKHQSDQNRIAEVLIIPPLMNLDLYLEMRMIAAYTSLWDDVIKQFMSHSSAKVLSHAMGTIRYFMDATSLSNSNSTKILELEDEMSTQLRDAIAGRDELEVASFSEDEVLALGAWCTRLAVLFGTRNMTLWMEEDEGGKQSSAWDILNALVERGRLGYKEEEMMIEQALHALTLHTLWKTKGLPVEEEPTPEEIRYKEVLVEQRESLLEKLVEFAIGTQSNTAEGVKRASFKHLLDLHVLFASSNAYSPDGTPLPTAALALSLDDETQYRCAGYIQAEIERYAELLDDEDDRSDGSNEDASDNDEDQEKPPKAKKAKKFVKDADISSRNMLEKEYLFIDVVSTFLRAIRCGAIHIQHGAVILAHYGRLEPSFDACSRIVVDVLREENLMKNEPHLIVSTLAQALEEAYTLVLDGLVRDETNATQLAKLLSNCFIVRGTHLSVLRRVSAQHIIQIHTNLLTWVGKRLAIYEKNKNKSSFKATVTFMKVLVPLLATLGSRDALKIKAHLEEVLAEAKVEVSNSKVWDPYRTYEKRLSTIMAKDEVKVPKKRSRKKKSGAGASSGEEESGGEGLNDEDEDEPVRPARRPRRVTRANPIVEETQEDEQPEDPTTPKARRRKAKSASPPPPPTDEEESVALTEPPESPMPSYTPPPEDIVTPKSSMKKRPRDDEEEEEAASDANEDQVNEVPDIQVRRKRIRH